MMAPGQQSKTISQNRNNNCLRNFISSSEDTAECHLHIMPVSSLKILPSDSPIPSYLVCNQQVLFFFHFFPQPQTKNWPIKSSSTSTLPAFFQLYCFWRPGFLEKCFPLQVGPSQYLCSRPVGERHKIQTLLYLAELEIRRLSGLGNGNLDFWDA